jgi:hypothetical protein
MVILVWLVCISNFAVIIAKMIGSHRNNPFCQNYI